jgi:hypothetical protein
MTQPDWDDERLAAAFRARFDRPAPPTLARAIHGAIAGTNPARRRLVQHRPRWGLAAAAVVVVLVTTITAGLGGLGRLGGGPSLPSDSGASSSPGANATPTEQALPGSVLGLEIITVSDAIAFRDAVTDDRELAVRGWFTPALLTSCGPAPGADALNPLQTRCPDTFVWLSEAAESLVHVGPNSVETGAPKGPALNPDLDALDTTWVAQLPQIGTIGDSIPTDVVFLGHFDDRRSRLCPDAEISACRLRFVVDSVAYVAGSPSPRSLVRNSDVPATSSLAEIEAVVANEAPQSPILSILTVDGPRGLAAIEPSLAAGQQGLINHPVLWVVRVLESEHRMVTYIIVDGTDAIYEMNPEGEAIRVGGTPPPTSSPVPWPPAGAIVISLTSPVGAGAPPVRVAVVDESGRLIDVTEKGAVDPSNAPVIDGPAAYAEPGRPGRVHLAWIGGVCDSQITVTVDPDVRSITFDIGPQVDCDAMGIGRELVLDFSASVDVPAIELLDTTQYPNPVQRDYALHCGPLGPDTCEQRAAALVVASQESSPAKRLESIAFADECGSYTMFYADGSRSSLSINCIQP